MPGVVADRRSRLWMRRALAVKAGHSSSHRRYLLSLLCR
jgi:hypothetical protein